jgi:hypothetical protein
MLEVAVLISTTQVGREAMIGLATPSQWGVDHAALIAELAEVAVSTGDTAAGALPVRG